MDVMPVVAGSVTIEVAFSGHIVGVRRGAGFDRGGEALLLQHSQQRFLLRHQGVTKASPRRRFARSRV